MFPIRILHLPNTLDKRSGVMSVIMNFYRNIDREKIQFDFLCFDSEKENYEDEINKLGGKIFYISSKYKKNPFRIKKEVTYFFSNHDYPIIHYHTISIWNLALRISKKLGVKNRIAHSHATNYSESKIGSIRNKIFSKNITKNANYFFACSTEAGELLFKNKKFILINNAIDLKRFSYDSIIRDEYRKKLGLINEFVIGHVGRYAEQKNHLYLLDIFAEYQVINNQSKLLLIGEGPLKENIEHKARELNIYKDIIFVGFNQEVEKYYQAMDLFILPSLYEGLPVAGIEAQASGLPCMFSNTISKEVDLCGSYFIDINEEALKNTMQIVNLEKNYIRGKTDGKIKEKNYDIELEAKKLEEMYLAMTN
ncbi:glycosyltransferase family 1 protein [Carnobacterium divergens]|nr:glycosyltransferase family 1 protein [Carnobacterium divergens]MDO0875220.1 glycosyltransferase family 1 protein [Carnobacterium divergens]SUX17587.1 GDP-mannose-dependent alpha-(1-6)-phosphatidylinositol monomannoside mannosyltransferase [Carnobacterium divergens]